MKIFKMVVGVLSMLMIGACAFKFGSTWNSWEWCIAGTVFIVIVLSMIAHKEAMALIQALPGIFSKIPFVVKKEEPKPPAEGEPK